MYSESVFFCWIKDQKIKPVCSGSVLESRQVRQKKILKRNKRGSPKCLKTHTSDCKLEKIFWCK